MFALEIEFLPLDIYTNKIRHFLANEFIFYSKMEKKTHKQNIEKRENGFVTWSLF